jgi:ubiquinone/menaquinone biosynthesis C-methylase UbiE
VTVLTVTEYIMGLPSEPQRIRTKTNMILVDHHLTWAGVRRGDSFVDFGCASGEVVRAAAGLVGDGEVVGIDADERMLEYAAAESQRTGLANVSYRRVKIGGVGSTGLPDAHFDHAWTRFFLEYMADPVGVVREMARVVRPGGRVTLIDLDGNVLWHHPLPLQLATDLEIAMAGLATTGFDPRAGSRLREYAQVAGLVDVRQQVEPYHWIVGRPDRPTSEAWTVKLGTIKQTYSSRVSQHGSLREEFFDDLLSFILADDTMTWSLAYLVQGTRPS